MMERLATISQPQLIARFLLLTCIVLAMHGLVLAGMSLPASTVTVDPNLWTHYWR
jgi:hypothetical protein